MTTITNPHFVQAINERLCRTGMPVRGDVLAKAWYTVQCLRNWRMGDFVANYFGRDSESDNGDPTAGTTSSYYIITGFPVRASGGAHKLGVVARLWKRGFDTGGGTPLPQTELWEWYKDKADASGDTLYSAPTPTTAATGSSIQYTDGATREFFVDVTPTTSNDGFRASKLTSAYALVHSLGVFGAPAALDLDEDQAIVTLSDIAPGQTVRGYDGGVGDSLGALVHYTNSGAADSAVACSRRCLLQTPYPIGAWADGTTSWTPIRQDSVSSAPQSAQTYKVKPRKLAEGATADLDCDVALVITADAGAQIRLSSATAGDTWTYTCGTDAAKLVTTGAGTGAAGSGLAIDPDGDYVTVETLCGTGKTLQLHAVSLWEPTSING